MKAHLALIGTNLFFAINYSSIKYLTGNQFAKPLGLNLVRVLFTSLVLWVLFALKPKSLKIASKDLPRFVLCALTGIVINQLLFIKGLSLTHAVHATLLMLTTPVIIMFIAAWLLKERITLFKFTGLFLSLCGALVLVISGKSGFGAENVLLGDILIFLNAISYAFYFILVKPLMKDYEPVMILRMIFLIGFIIMLPISWSQFSEIQWQSFTPIAWINVLLLAAGGTLLNYLFNIYGIGVLGASVAGTYIYSQPLMATAISMIFMGESLELYKIIGGLLIFGGLFLANLKKSVSA